MPLTVKKHRKKKIIRNCNKKKIRRQHYKLPKIEMSQVAKNWNDHKSVKKNFSEMGLSHNPNYMIRKNCEFLTKQKPEKENGTPSKLFVEKLESDAKAPRTIKFKFPIGQAMYYSYLIKKYGDNYQEMAKDPKNIYQQTWKQIRSKILQFKKLDQYRKLMNYTQESRYDV